MLRRRATSMTASASREAMAAWAKPSAICEWKSDLSMQHLRGGSSVNEVSFFDDRDTLAHAARLIAVVRDGHAGERGFAGQLADELLDAGLCRLVERRGWFVEQ